MPTDLEAARRARVRRYLSMLTDADWQRIGAHVDHAKSLPGNDTPAALNDLSCPLRVGVCHPGEASRFSGERIGEMRGMAILVWPMTETALREWRARR